MPVRRVSLVIGTRPEAIKLSPVVRELQRREGFEADVVITGQHREMLAPTLDALGLVGNGMPGVARTGDTLADVAIGALEHVDRALAVASPAVVIVQGDTTSAFAGALAAFYRGIPVVHVEAGLRTGDVTMPFPEEANRRLVAPLAALHLAPTASAAANLRAEGIADARILVTGNTVIDTLQWAIDQPLHHDPMLAAVEADGRPLILVTVHRREAWATELSRVAKALAAIASEGDAFIVLPAHVNPIVRAALVPELQAYDNVRIVEPLPYITFCHLLARARVAVTDSGGIQEEAPSLGVPVVVLRDVTERPEAVRAGNVVVVGTDPESIRRTVVSIVRDDRVHDAMSVPSDCYGDGRAAARCVDAIEWLLGDRETVASFIPRVG